MAGEQVRRQAAANRAAVEMHDFKRLVIEALKDPEFRAEFWHALAVDARTARTSLRTGRPPTAATTEQARALKAVRTGRQGG